MRLKTLFVVLFATGLAGFLVMAQWRSAEAHRSHTLPHTVVTQEILTGRDGETHEGVLTTRAQRQDGASVMKLGRRRQDGSRVITLPSGMQIMTNDENRRKSSEHRASAPNRSHRHPSSNCQSD